MMNQQKNCKKCQNPIPNERKKLGFDVCVNCSEVDTYGCVNIINHKTGNTVQVMSKEEAKSINKIGDRKRFGTVLRGGSKNNSYNPKGAIIGCSSSFVGSEFAYERIGAEAMTIMEFDGLDSAMAFIDKQVSDYLINKNQAFKIKSLIRHLYEINVYK